MSKQEEAYQKQEKVFKVLFLVMIMALGLVFCNVLFSESSAANQKAAMVTARGEEAVTPMCVLNKEQKKTVDSIMPALCCLNRKK